MEPTMKYLDLDALESAPLETAPYDHIVVSKFLKPERFEGVSADFPAVPGPGSHPPSQLTIAGEFQGLMNELLGPEFRDAVGRKFAVDLSGYPAMYTVRGFTRKKDGSAHTDSKTKILTVLLYLNQEWSPDGGRLRILNSDNVEDYVKEVPPFAGTLLIFRRSDTSWHGHLPFEGQRRTIQLNWVTSQAVVDREQGRHAISTLVKKVTNLFQPAS